MTTVLLFNFVNKANSQQIIIGTQIWAAKNLDVSTFRNGDQIPETKTNEEWKAAGKNKTPAWCYYENDPAFGKILGKLYNWYAVNDSRGLAPSGWHVPSDAEWTTLTNYLGGEIVAGTKMKNQSGWYKNGNGTNESGFAGFPGGYRKANGVFVVCGFYGYWGDSTEHIIGVFVRGLSFNGGDVFRDNYGKQCGLSYRCIKD